MKQYRYDMIYHITRLFNLSLKNNHTIQIDTILEIGTVVPREIIQVFLFLVPCL